MNLTDYRQQIDEIDGKLLHLFEERMSISREIACYKKEHGLATLDTAREQEKLAIIDEKASAELRPYAHTLYLTILNLSRMYQESTCE